MMVFTNQTELKMKKYTFLILTISFLSCQMDSNNYQRESISTKEANSPLATHASSDKAKSTKKIIRSAATRFEVVDVIHAINDISEIALLHEGYISDQNMSDIEGKQQANLILKVPSDSLDLVLRKCSNIAVHIDYMKVNSKDVSEEYVDLLTRLQTKKEVHQRYIDILRNKAGTIEELLSAERKIGILQEEIEAAQGKIRYYDNKVKLSTLDIQIYKKEVMVAKVESRFVPFWDNAENGLIGGWNMIVRLMIALIALWPLILIGSILYYYRKKLWIRWIK